MTVSTHITNSTVPDCRMRVPRRRNTSIAQSWRFLPDAILPGHRRAHWWVPAWTPRYTSPTAHTSTWHRSTQQTRTSPKQIHEVTNTDSVIPAHGSGACYDHTAAQVCQRFPGTGTPYTFVLRAIPEPTVGGPLDQHQFWSFTPLGSKTGESSLAISACASLKGPAVMTDLTSAIALA